MCINKNQHVVSVLCPNALWVKKTFIKFLISVRSDGSLNRLKGQITFNFGS